MAEAAVLAGVGWAVSPIITKLLNEGFDKLGETNIKDRLNNLETIRCQLQLVIEAAEKIEHKTEMGQWLRTLKDALCEAEDVLDLYKYQLLEEKVNDLNSNLTAKFYSKFVGNLSYQKIKLRRSLERLEKIAARADEFLKLKNESSSATHDSNEGQQPDVTDSIPPLQVFGRDKERDEIIDKYLLDTSEASESEKCYSVVAIVGIGGVGKTTLAQEVYNDERLEKKFDIKMWVCVSRRLDVLVCTRKMIESASTQIRPPSLFPPRESEDVLKRDLIDRIKSKKILLILDDVWFDNSSAEEWKWENFIAPLAKAGNRGSRILVTTRRTDLPQALHPRYSMMLQDLDEDAIHSLFNHHAFYGANLNDAYLKEQLEHIGKKIVQKLHRSPLAAKVVGCQLRRKLEISNWRQTLDEDNLSDARGALLWSYRRLDARLQRCFSYFSLFPKGSLHSLNLMLLLWIGEGVINSWNDSTRMEDIGREYFHELVSNSFLQHDKDYDGVYYMNDLVHDLAENISKGDCFRIEEDEHLEEIPLTIRHLSIWDSSLKENSTSLQKLKKLRTLFIVNGSHESSAIDHIFAATVKKCKKLRVLLFEGVPGVACIERLPESIGDLKHLRWLYLGSKLFELPASLGKLYHLQLLSIPMETNLPGSLKNLINLRHFEGNSTTVPYIGRLTSLQALRKFDVKKEKGYDIGQLKNLKEIRGELTISCLENVGGNNRAAEASLKNKRHLDSLSLEWDNYDDDSERSLDLDLEVLEGLRPHPNLTNLTIKGYKSRKYPSWLLQEGCLPNLESLQFHKCTWLEVLPDMRKLCPRCHKLEIWNLLKLKKFPLLPESLKILVISECPSLVIVSKEDLQEGREDFFAGQEKIELLQELKIKSCDITDRALSQSLRSLASLKCLKLEEINTITTLPPEEVLQHLISLTELEIIGCSQLKSLGGLYALPSLEKLEIEGVPSLKLEMLASGEGGGRGIFPPSLRTLHISGSTTMESSDIGDLPNLDDLFLRNIPSLASLSMSRLTVLRELKIYECPLLSSLPSNLPDSLKDLDLRDCSGISSLSEHLPESVSKIWLMGCPGILSLPEHLPESLSVIYLWGCPGIKSLPEHLPESVREISLLECPGILSLPEHLPESLSKISLLGCPGILSLPEDLPESVIEIVLRGCPGILSLPEHLPESVREISLRDCPGILSLPEHLPESVSDIWLWDCPGIKSLPEHLPVSLRHISIKDCPVLKKRCRSPDGEDWPKIAHIPSREIYNSETG